MFGGSARATQNGPDAMAKGDKLPLLEMVLQERASAHLAMIFDLAMLVTVGGKERTRAETANLFRAPVSG